MEFGDAVIDKLLTASQISSHAFVVSGDLRIFREGSRRLDINMRTGEVWMADEAKLWKPKFDGPTHGPLPETAADRAETFLRDIGLGPFVPAGYPHDVKVPMPVESRAVRCILNRKTGKFGPRVEIWLDSYASFITRVDVTALSPPGTTWVPLVGRGLKRGVTFAPNGDIIAFHGAVPRQRAKSFLRPMIEREESQNAFRARLHQLDFFGAIESELAYQWNEGSGGAVLHPVWLHSASVMTREGEYAPKPMALPTVAYPAAQSYVDLTGDCPTVLSAGWLSPTMPAAAPLATGVWWFEDGEISAKRNAHGFLGGMSNAKWQIVADRGGIKGLKDDWLAHASKGVDQADLVYYAGHADGQGWCFDSLDNCAQVSDSALGDGDVSSHFYGQRLKWLVICACGPLQDQIVTYGHGDAFDRWRGAFDGLHTMVGYATPIGDRCHVGERLASLLPNTTVIDAWLRAAREIQVGPGASEGSTVRAAALYAFDCSSNDPLLDSVGPTPIFAKQSPQPHIFTGIWTPA
jgi:hypothetical protein